MSEQLVAHLYPTQPSEEQNWTSRARELLGKLDWKEPTQTDVETQQLKTLVLEYADVFALTTTELGSTELVHHTIDTAKNSPCHRPVRRIPFSLCEKANQMVSDMLEQGVI